MNVHSSCRSALVWFRRDLRDYNHAALAAALAAAEAVYCAFVFDRKILAALPSRNDRRVHFIHASLLELDAALRARGGGLIVRHGLAEEMIPELACQLGVDAVFANRDYEPSAKARDTRIASRLKEHDIAFHLSKDQVIFDGSDVLTQSGRPFTVFTPYCRAWLRRLANTGVTPFDANGRLAATPLAQGIPELSEIGFCTTDLAAAGLQTGMSGAQATWERFQERLDRYARERDFPALNGGSGLSTHLRFGTISIRQLVAHTLAHPGAASEIWLRELVWREFYSQLLDHFPRIAESSFLPAAESLVWDDWPAGFAAWRDGNTGYPLIDAAMRRLAASGNMHNRLRMLTASFLCKDLGIDWRLGERHFANLLNDFDLAANNGGWQWCASTGCDAQPWFRIFNPVTQSEKFDPQGRTIRLHVPELAGVPDRYIHAPWQMSEETQAACGVSIGRDYPPPIVNHATARQRTLARYAALRNRAVP